MQLARRLPDVAAGDVVTVVADDPAAKVDIPAWCRMRRQEYLGEDRAPDGVPRFWVRRAAEPDASPSAS
ncbi:MAG: sulfurtransferase TusA family protein [Nocardioides sp.]